jgi:hypothetical protein
VGEESDKAMQNEVERPTLQVGATRCDIMTDGSVRTIERRGVP